MKPRRQEKRARNASVVPNKRMNLTSNKPSQSTINRVNTSVTHHAYTTNDNDRQKIRQDLEHKFGGPLPPKKPSLKSKHNFKNSDKKPRKVSESNVPQTDSVIKLEIKEKENIKDLIKKDSKDINRSNEIGQTNEPIIENLKVKLKQSNLSRAQKGVVQNASSSTTLRSKNASYSLMERRNIRKQEKQDSQIRTKQGGVSEFQNHFEELK